MRCQPQTAPNLASLDHGKIDRWVVGCYLAQSYTAILVAVLYSWLLGIFLFLAMHILLAIFSTWAFYDNLCGIPFPGPRLKIQSDRCCQNEALEMQPIHNEGIDSRWPCMPYSNSSTYGYCPVDDEVAVYDSPPYDVLPAPNNSIMTNNDALAPAPHHFMNGKPKESKESTHSPTG
ncbi:hypothetical protein F5Y03DRAFT_46322 [Xylaria venustula]|nr:hypothetical protein F5Y03DRAFT_46322 [Xylaria venustula]